MGQIGEKLITKSNIQDIFENGSNEDVQKLLELEGDPNVSEEQRALITEVRKRLEAKETFMHTGIPFSTSGQVGKTPNLSETELNND